jgi:hypothetical protein
MTAKKAEIHGLPDLFGEIEWTYLAILLVIAAVGPGSAALDAFVARRLKPRRVIRGASGVDRVRAAPQATRP